MKNQISKMLAALLIFQLLIGQTYIKVSAALDTNITITGFSASSSTVYKGDNFTVNITIKNTASAGDMDYVYMNIDPSKSSYSPSSGDSTIKLCDSLPNGASVSKTISLTYDGTDAKRLSFQFVYKLQGGTEASIDKSISINAKSPSEIPAPTPVDTKKYVPKLSVASGSIPSVQPGDTFSLALPIKDINNQPAKDITITPVIDGDAIFLEDFNASKDIASINANETQTVSFRFRVSSNAAARTYPVKINMDYSNLFGDNYTAQSTVYIKVLNGVQNVTSAEITNIDTSTGSIKPGDKVKVTITAKNTGNNNLKSMKFYLSGFKDDALSINGGTNKKTVSNIAPGQEVKIDFTLLASKNAADGNYMAVAKLEGVDTADKTIADEQSFYIAVSKNEVSGLEITNIDISPNNIEPGDKTIVNVTAKNTGNSTLSSMKFYLNGLKDDAFSIIGGTNRKVSNDLAPGQETQVTFTLSAEKKANEGNYSMSVKAEGRDSSSKSVNDEQFFNVQVEDEDSNIDIDNIVSPNSALVSNKEFKVGFSLSNTGDKELKNVKVTITPDPVIVTKTPTVKVISKLKPNDKFPLSYLFMIPKGAADKNYPIQISAEYEVYINGQRVKQSTNQYISVYVDNSNNAENKKSVPKIIIDKYSINPTIPFAGNNIKLNVSFLNTNPFKAVRNIKIYLSSSDGGGQSDSGNVFVPVNSSNTFYIDNIMPKSRVEKEIELYVINDAKPKTYNLTANFEYEDDNGTEYKASEIIGVPVRPQAKVETSDISLPAEVSITDPLSVSFDIYNTGKSILRNLMIKSIGNFDVQNQNSFIGNLDVGNQEHYEAAIVPKAPGKLSGTVLISFEDAAGQKQQVKKEISTNVINPPPVVTPDMNNQGNPQTKANSLLNNKFMIGGGVLLGLIAVALIILIKKKRKKRLEEMMLGE